MLVNVDFVFVLFLFGLLSSSSSMLSVGGNGGCCWMRNASSRARVWFWLFSFLVAAAKDHSHKMRMPSKMYVCVWFWRLLPFLLSAHLCNLSNIIPAQINPSSIISAMCVCTVYFALYDKCARERLLASKHTHHVTLILSCRTLFDLDRNNLAIFAWSQLPLHIAFINVCFVINCTWLSQQIGVLFDAFEFSDFVELLTLEHRRWTYSHSSFGRWC